MAAHRYWRIASHGGQSSANATIGLSEVQFRGTIGGSNLATGGIPSTNLVQINGVLANAFDGNTATGVTLTSGLSATGYIAYDFGSTQDIAEVYLRSLNTGNSGVSDIRLNAHLEYSDDAVTWVALAPSFDTTGLSANATAVSASGFFAAANPRVTPTTPRLPTSWPTGAPLRLSGAKPFRELDAGRYFIAGTTKIDDSPDIPVSRQVRLYHKATGRFVAETWSAEGTGAYRFENLKNQTYFAIAFDHTAYYDALAHDALLPEAMA